MRIIRGYLRTLLTRLALTALEATVDASPELCGAVGTAYNSRNSQLEQRMTVY
ncbi:MAG: hypothetical protein ACTHK7_12765 [Aureliella sp.]